MRQIQQTVRRLSAMVTDVGSSPVPPHAIIPITLAFGALINILQGAVSTLPTEFLSRPLIGALVTLQGSIDILTQCSTEGSKLAIEPSSCYALADIYRGVTEDAAGSSPALNLPIDAPENLRRLAGGSLTILDMLSKNSIAATNEDLLSSRPIFAADILDQYRIELIRVTMDEEIKGYAVAALGTVVGVSNSLEACLRVAADPIAAIDELNDELEAQAFYDDEEEDEDEEDEDEE
ncbi:MAG: hypothetical protein J3R72DRAFT_420569 [Linnemannia gamsii]|nr:MAG: hypothetical protein J3R72DRAFT_420569 [Linnemannia gamsii]